MNAFALSLFSIYMIVWLMFKPKLPEHHAPTISAEATE